MDVNFKVIEPAAVQPIVFDIIFAEKVGGGRVKNCAYDLPVGVAVDAEGNAIKAFKVVEAAESDATSLKIAKGSGVAVDDVIATGNAAAVVTAVDSTGDAYDVVTVSLGVAVEAGKVLFEGSTVGSGSGSGAGESASATPKYTPMFVLGEFIPANSGDKLVKLVNGANVRKETILIADELLALMPMIQAL